MLKVQNNSMGCYNSTVQIQNKHLEGCGHFYGCGRDDRNKPITILRRWTKGYYNYQETNYDETEASSHRGCAQQFKNILELLNPEDKGAMILQHCSNYE